MSDPALRLPFNDGTESRFSAGSLVLRVSDVASLLASLCNVAGIAVVETDKDGNIVFANDRFHALNRQCGGESCVRLPGFDEQLRRVRASLSRQVAAQEIQLSDRLMRFWQTTMPILDDMENLTGVAAIYQDWTQQLSKIEESAAQVARFRDFARAASDFFWECDANLNLIGVSDGLVALLELPQSALAGRPLDSLGLLRPNSTGEQPLARALALHGPFRNQLLEMKLPDGGTRLFHLSAVTVQTEAGHFAGYRGAAMDVTRAYRLEEDARLNRNRLEAAMAEAQRSSIALEMESVRSQSAGNAKNEFLAAMSHELRTPLNAIIGFAESMEMQVFGDLPERYLAYAQDIRSAGQHLLGLINDILDVSVIESGEVPMTLEPVSVAKILNQATALVALRASAKNLDLSALRSDHSGIVQADERRLLQILVNLITNAVKFTPDGGKIGAKIEAQSGMLAITVWDTGPGIGIADQGRVFDRFQQLVTETYRGKPEGTGLGLHISRELARLMGGDITLSSEPGAGARFQLTLPAA